MLLKLSEILAAASNYENALKKRMKNEILSEKEMIDVVYFYSKVRREIPNRLMVEDIALLLLNWYPKPSNASLVKNCRNLYKTKAFKKSEELLALFKKSGGRNAGKKHQ